MKNPLPATPQETADQAHERAEGDSTEAIMKASKTAIADSQELLARIAEENARSG
jgi:hypothetical protein